MDAFEVWYPVMKSFEGGYVNHPFDPGGNTNMGITLETFQSLAPTVLGIPGTLDNLKNLTNAQHKLIAKYFWSHLGDSSISTYNIRNWGIQYQAMEQYWGSGGSQMFPLQHAVNRLRANKIAVDGYFGKITLGALNEIVNQEQLFHYVYEARLNFYDAIIQQRPKLNYARNGWQWRLMIGYEKSCTMMGYTRKTELYERLLKWSPHGPKVLPFQDVHPEMKRINGQKFNDPGFGGNPQFNPNQPDKKYWLSPVAQVADEVATSVKYVLSDEKKNFS